jgi:alpha-mannosidase II
MPHLLSLAGYQTAVVNRVHYAFKKNLAWNKALEFRWRQEWQGTQENTDMITHMFPFFIYDLAHTCGPDPKICSRYEFGKAGRSTLWHDPIVLPTEATIAKMSEDYADQIKKKATLFRTGKTVMIPLGQDFMYDTEQEMESMLTNHEWIHKYINSHPEMGIKIRFGTLSDYWNSVKRSVAHGSLFAILSIFEIYIYILILSYLFCRRMQWSRTSPSSRRTFQRA